jgi:hypothetical protein
VPGESHWKDEVIAAEKKGNSPGGENTHVGILVSVIRYTKRTLSLPCHIKLGTIPCGSEQDLLSAHVIVECRSSVRI